MPARLPPRLALGGEQAAAAPPGEVVHVLLPRGQRRRHALARQQVRDQGPQRGEPRVAAGVQRPVARQRREVGEVGAHRVEHGQRAVGAADRDVDVEAEHHLPLDRPRVGGLERVVAGEVAQRALGGGERDACPSRPGAPSPRPRRRARGATRRAPLPPGRSCRTPAWRSRSGRRPAPRAATPARRAPRARARPPAAGRACRGRAPSAPPRRRSCGRSPRRRARAGARGVHDAHATHRGDRPARRRPSAGSPPTGLEPAVAAATTGASARSRASGWTTCARSASSTVGERADGRGRGPAPGALAGARTGAVTHALGRHAVALASVREVAARAGAQRVVLLVDEGDGDHSDDGRVGRGRDVRAHRGGRHRGDGSRDARERRARGASPTCARCRRRR